MHTLVGSLAVPLGRRHFSVVDAVVVGEPTVVHAVGGASALFSANSATCRPCCGHVMRLQRCQHQRQAGCALPFQPWQQCIDCLASLQALSCN